MKPTLFGKMLPGACTTLVVDSKAEAGFRRRALKAMPNEYLETLWGVVKGDTVYIHVFMPIAQRSKPEVVLYQDEDMDDQEDEALEEKLELIGTIHTHPGCIDAIFSEGDTRETQESHDMVVAVCAIVKNEGEKRRSCLIQYWPAPRPLKVVYRTHRKKKK